MFTLKVGSHEPCSRPVFTGRAEKKHCTTMLFGDTGRHGCARVPGSHEYCENIFKVVAVEALGFFSGHDDVLM